MAKKMSSLLGLLLLLLVTPSLATNCMYQVDINVGSVGIGNVINGGSVMDNVLSAPLNAGATLVLGTNTIFTAANQKCFNPCQVSLNIGGTGSVTINSITVTKTQDSTVKSFTTISGTRTFDAPSSQIFSVCH